MAESGPTLEAFARSGPAGPFIERAFEACGAPSSVAFRALFASVPRRLGENARERPLPPAELAASARPHLTWTDWVRVAMTSRALAGTPAAERGAVLLRLFEGGEIGEQESILRTLALLPNSADFVETGLLGCRTNARRVFEAVACENPFPASHFPDLGFNQMVMKAIFIEVPVARIEGIVARRGAELVRMLEDYASERRAAGRPVPNDVGTLLGGQAS